MHHPSLALTIEDRLRHVLVVGKTGMGKSTLLRSLCRRDIAEGHGLLLVDPHGDLAEQVLADLPRRRRNDLVVFDAKNPGTCPGLNPLRAVAPESRALVVSNVLATMRKLWPEFWGPRTEHVLRHALLALTEVRGATLIDAQRMLVDDKRRRSVLRQVTDEGVLWFWAQEFASYGKNLTAEATAPVLNKLGALLASPVVRAVVTKARPLVDARMAMDRGRVVVASLPKGRVGEDAALLMGGLLLGAFQHAAMARADLPPEERRPFFLVIDEATSFATGPFLGMIAEARKYGVGLVLATQSLAVLPDDVRAALLGNVGTLVVFRVGGDDALILGREFGGDYGADNLMRLDVGEMIVRVGATLPRHAQATSEPSS
jgi:DNA helicase HerA-like ATPase